MPLLFKRHHFRSDVIFDRGGDSDGDGHCDNDDPFPARASTGDRDQDGTVDGQDSDNDNDGIPDASDTCRGKAGPNTDSDGDGRGDICDNCPDVYNPNQLDSTEGTGDNYGDACDACPDYLNECVGIGCSDPSDDQNGDRIPTDCQCGDTNLDGFLLSNDASAIFGCGSNPLTCPQPPRPPDADAAPHDKTKSYGGRWDTNLDSFLLSNDASAIFGLPSAGEEWKAQCGFRPNQGVLGLNGVRPPPALSGP